MLEAEAATTIETPGHRGEAECDLLGRGSSPRGSAATTTAPTIGISRGRSARGSFIRSCEVHRQRAPGRRGRRRRARTARRSGRSRSGPAAARPDVPPIAAREARSPRRRPRGCRRQPAAGSGTRRADDEHRLVERVAVELGCAPPVVTGETRSGAVSGHLRCTHVQQVGHGDADGDQRRPRSRVIAMEGIGVDVVSRWPTTGGRASPDDPVAEQQDAAERRERREHDQRDRSSPSATRAGARRLPTASR